MYTMLIVDDEPIIANSLVSMFNELKLDLEIKVAYNANNAIAISEKLRIDILLTDIRMPGMDGLELQRVLKKQRDLCQAIFLTGHNEFEYAQDALRNGGYDFILKTEDDDVVINAVKNAINKLDVINRDSIVLSLADDYIERSRPLLRDKFWQKILSGEIDLNIDDFTVMNIGLDPNHDICMMMCSLQSNNADFKDTVPTILSLVNQYLNPRFILEEFTKRDDLFMWFMQSKTNIDNWIRDFGFLNATLDMIQNICSDKLNVDIKFVVNSSPIKWNDIEETSIRIMNILKQSQIPKNSGVMTDLYAEKFIRQYDVTTINQVRKQIDILKMLSESIANNKKEIIKQNVNKLFDILQNVVDYSTLTEGCMSLGLIFLHYINDHNLSQNLSTKFTVEKLFPIVNSFYLTKLKKYYLELVDELSDKYHSEIHGQTNRMVYHVQQYIKMHLDGDLSLPNLSELVQLNSSYLSRLYKSHTGNSISDTISQYKIEHAKNLLTNSYLKISEIGQELGFNNPAHFTRFLKKYTGMTPNEYRAKHK